MPCITSVKELLLTACLLQSQHIMDMKQNSNGSINFHVYYKISNNGAAKKELQCLGGACTGIRPKKLHTGPEGA